MPLSPVKLELYRQRLGHGGPVHADLATLQALHALHPLSIPFENLDSWLRVPVALDLDAVHAKLVTCGRGGYCFEHNRLFMQVLRAFGFTVSGLAARVVWNMPEGIVLPRTHMLLLVELDEGDYIADVGFGGLTMSAALKLDTQETQHSPHEDFRILQRPDHYMVQARLAGNWQSLYRFTLEEQTDADYAMANWYVSTHPESRFVNNLIAARVDTDGRHALQGRRYTRYRLGKAPEQLTLDSSATVRDALHDAFRIDTAALPGLDARLATLFQGD